MSTTTAPRAIDFTAPSPVRRWLRDLPLLPLLILLPFALAAICAPFIAPYDPTEPVPGAKVFAPPLCMADGRAAALRGADLLTGDLPGGPIDGAPGPDVVRTGRM